MLFQKKFHEGIRSGAITRTFRAWQGPKVRAGETYRAVSVGLLQVDVVEQVALADIRDREARAAGFDSAKGLIAMLRKNSTRKLQSRSKVYSVRFRYCGPIIPATRTTVTAAALQEVQARLQRMDRLSKRSAWTRKVLQLIGENPGTAAAKLAPRVERETRPFKADVRKLKGLGLTESLEVGYKLTALGKAVVKN